MGSSGTIWMQLEEGRMHRFVAALLTGSGALVEPIAPDGLEVLAGPALQQTLGIGELARLGFGPTLPEGARRIGIESDWLGRCAQLIGERGRHARRLVRPDTRKAPDAKRVLEQEFVLENAVARLVGATPAWTRYIVPSFRFTALSDEKREGLLRLPINLATGAMPDAMLPRLDTLDEAAAPEDRVEPEADALPGNWPAAQLAGRLRQALPWRAEEALAPFLKGLRRRLDRDLDRLHGYHSDLHREAVLRAGVLARGDSARLREEQRMTAIARDYRVKLDDLGRRYALHVSAIWVQTQDILVPVQRLTVQIRRRKAERVMVMDWNPLTRRLELPSCEATWSTAQPRLVCDEALHLVVPAGLAPCATCVRSYCRACHAAACPKCGHTDRPAAFASSRMA
jgi:hypothetical protein